MIYLFIAGSYTPWLNLRQLDGDESDWDEKFISQILYFQKKLYFQVKDLTRLHIFPGASVELRWAVWLLATLGILYQQIFHER